MQCDGLSNEQVTNWEDILARMQGVRRLLSLLCPMFGATEDTEMQTGMPTEPMGFVTTLEQPS